MGDRIVIREGDHFKISGGPGRSNFSGSISP